MEVFFHLFFYCLKKKRKLFVISEKSSTFASRLLSKVYKRFILRILIVLCPGTFKNGDECVF